MKKKTIIIAAVVIIIIGLIIAMNLNSKREKPIKTTVDKVKKTDLTSIISASGEIKPKKNINISAQIPGRILKIGVVEGQEVKRGDFLLKLDSSQYEANAERDRAFIQSTKTEEIKAEATTKRSLDSYQRQKNLYDNELISKELLEQAKVQLDIAEASSKAISFQIDQAQASLKSSLDNLAKTVFSAPIDGIITSLRIEEGEVAIIGTMNNPGTVLMTIADLSVMEVEVEVDETDVIGVVLGQTADVRVDAFPDRVFEGKVTEIGSSALQKTGVSAAAAQESKDFKVVITLDDPRLLKPGLSASADIISAEKKNVLAVPISALVTREKKDAQGEKIKKDKKVVEEEGLYIIENGRVRFVAVEKGITGELEIEIISGLKEGQEVVVGPYDVLRLLKDGDLIKPDTKTEVKK
jgi:HlyD family secretion protein